MIVELEKLGYGCGAGFLEGFWVVGFGEVGGEDCLEVDLDEKTL